MLRTPGTRRGPRSTPDYVIRRNGWTVRPFLRVTCSRAPQPAELQVVPDPCQIERGPAVTPWLLTAYQRAA